MIVEHLEVMVEEPSMEIVLRTLLPKMLPSNTSFQIYPSNGKEELLGNLPARLRGYKAWLPKTWRVIVIVDCDDDDCVMLKQQMDAIAAQTGLVAKHPGDVAVWQVVNRIAIEELEAWFFGDMDAVRLAYPGVAKTLENRQPYRNPDGVRGGTWEALERVLQTAGYFTTGLRKLEAARAIASQMNPQRNRSRSFNKLRETLSSCAGSL